MKILTIRRLLSQSTTMVAAVLCAGLLSAEEPPAKEAVDAGKAVETGVRWLYVNTLRLSGGMDALVGVEVIPAEEVLRLHLGLAEGQGLVVTGVAKDGPAAKAGIQVNDVLVTIGDQNITDIEAFRKRLEESLDQPVKVGYVRAGRRQTVELTPRAKMAAVVADLDRDANADLSVAVSPRYWLGVGLASADATLRSQLSVADAEGLVVTSVENDSPAAKAGVMVNDLLLKLDGKTIKTIEETTAQLQELANKSAALELLRRGKPATLTVTAEKHPQANVNFEVVSSLDRLIVFTLAADDGCLLNASLARDLTIASTQSAAGGTAKPDLAAQVNSLLEQARQLQSSLEALQAAINTTAAPASKEEPKPAKP